MSVDVTKDSSTCLACVYLNEYKVAVAAFTLHASENKLVRVGLGRVWFLFAFLNGDYCNYGPFSLILIYF